MDCSLCGRAADSSHTVNDLIADRSDDRHTASLTALHSPGPCPIPVRVIAPLTAAWPSLPPSAPPTCSAAQDDVDEDEWG